MKTFKQIRNDFWATLPEDLRKDRRSRKTQNEYCTDIRVAFTDFIDHLHKSGEITDKQAQNITL
jgi:hypothetical protein